MKTNFLRTLRTWLGSVFGRRRSHIPDNQLTADLDKLEDDWRRREQLRDRQVAAASRGGRG